MTKLQKSLILFLLLVSLIFKDSIIAIFTREESFRNIETGIYDLEKKELLELNEEIKLQYGYTDFYPYNLEHTKVLYKTPYDFEEKITLYKGQNQGILKDQLVINEDGLVGLIEDVFKNTSEAILLTNSKINLPVKINKAYGTLTSDKNKIFITGIKASYEVEVGDKIYTSDLASYPKNILIGEVADIKLNNYEIEKIITVSPAVDFTNINYLSIITACRGETCS